MLSRIALRWSSIGIGFRNHKMFRQSACRMDKATADATTYEHLDTDMNNDGNNAASTMDNATAEVTTYEHLRRFSTLSTNKKDDDNNSAASTMITTIKSARNSYELLNIVSKNVKQFSADETLAALRTLFHLQKQTTTSINQADILRNSDFERLCASLKRNAKLMELNDVVDSLKIISFMGTKASSEVTMSLLNLIKYQINDVTLGHIVFLHFLLKQLEPNALVDALLIALPVVLQIQIGTKIDYENVSQLTDLLTFVANNPVGDQCVMNIVNALTLQGHDLSVEQARLVIWSLASTTLRVYNPNCDKLLDNAIAVMKRESVEEDFSKVLTTLTKMIGRYMDDPNRFAKFYDEKLYKKFADFVVTNDLGFENATFVQRQLNKLGFVHIKLLKYMLQEVVKYPALITDGKSTCSLSLISALSQANYKPDNWNSIRSLILQSSLLTKNNRLTLPLVKLSIELLSMGIECPSVWNRVFSKEFLSVELARDKGHKLLRLLELYQFLKLMTKYDVDNRIDGKLWIEAKKTMLSVVDHPMQQYVESAFGGSSFVYTKVRTQLGHVIDHVIAFDKCNLEPVRIADDYSQDVFYDDITMDNATKQYIAVLSFPSQCYCINMPILRGIYDLKLRSFEKMGIPVVLINQSSWNDLNDYEKIPYIQREVRMKLTEQQSDSVECQ